MAGGTRAPFPAARSGGALLRRDRQSWTMTGMRVALVIGAVLLVACGSDGNGGPSVLEQKCLDFADVACSSNAKCAVSTGAIQQTDSAMFVSSCKTAVVNGLGCSTVKAVSGSVANCKAD